MAKPQIYCGNLIKYSFSSKTILSKNASDKPLLVSNLTNLLNCCSRLRHHHSHSQNNIEVKSCMALRESDRTCPPGGVVLQREPHVLTALAGLLNSMVTRSVDNVNGHQCCVSGSLNPHFIWSFFQFQVSTFLSGALLIVLALILILYICSTVAVLCLSSDQACVS